MNGSIRSRDPHMPVVIDDWAVDGATDDLGVVVNVVIPLIVGSLLFALCFYRCVCVIRIPIHCADLPLVPAVCIYPDCALPVSVL